MQTYTPAEIRTADRTALTSYTTAEALAFGQAEPLVVPCAGGCGRANKVASVQWVPVDFNDDNSRVIAKRVATARWACTDCGPKHLR